MAIVPRGECRFRQLLLFADGFGKKGWRASCFEQEALCGNAVTGADATNARDVFEVFI